MVSTVSLPTRGFSAPIPFFSTEHPAAVLAIGGSDCAGLAGIQADNAVIQAFGCHAMNVISAVTAQNNEAVISVNPTADTAFSDQLQAIATLPLQALKIGLLANTQQQQMVAQFISNLAIPAVWDPVGSATSGGSFFQGAADQTSLTALINAATVVTPNIPEAEALTGIAISHVNDVVKAAQQLHQLGATAVYIKGGHTPNDNGYSQDYFSWQDQQFWLSSARSHTQNLRGTGCMLASMIAAALAHGYNPADAAVIAKIGLNQAIRQHYALGEDDKHKGKPRLIGDVSPSDLPLLSADANLEVLIQQPAFPRCDETPLGLYPVVDSVAWLKRLLPLGITTAQLRVKDLQGQALETEIQQAIEIGQHYGCRLFINDYWQLAIKYNAYGVHLGQEDLDDANVHSIHAAGLRLGVSTHCYYEVARAASLKPSYIAIGPIYETTSKIMPWQPQGIDRLAFWLRLLDQPLVAIGGIHAGRITGVAQTGVSSVAMITGITQADDPEHTAKDFQAICERYCQ